MGGKRLLMHRTADKLLNPPEAMEWFHELRTALDTLLLHTRGAAECGDGCISKSSPDAPDFDCDAYRYAEHMQARFRDHTVVVLNSVTPPVAGVENVNIPRGEIGIDVDRNRVVLWSKDEVPSYSAAEAIEVGTALVAAGREAAKQPDPDEVELLAKTIGSFPHTDYVELARHLLKSGYERTDNSDD